jgi:hypothetical protein
MVSVLDESHGILQTNICNSWQHQKSVRSYSMGLTRR